MEKAVDIEVIGIKPWKRWQIDAFLGEPGIRLHYARSVDAALQNQARHGGECVIWAAREPPGFAARAQAQGAPVVRIEDGFLRSVGLGSTHVGGASLVVDREGIYFDPRQPSTLERLLQAGEFDDAILARAAQLRKQLVASGVTKYNTGRRIPVALGGRPGQRRVLVPGQVEDDASIRQGAPGVCRNLDLLAKVRAAEPAAWILYKPHPDTEARTRVGHVPDSEALRFADQIVRDTSVTALFPLVQSVHTMTSLVGFEALLRGVPVVTWGMPFFAGWGLTDDHLPSPRRTRRISLDQLVAAALIRYPRYIDPLTRRPCEVEQLAAYLAIAPASRAANERSRLLRYGRLGIGLYRSWKSARGD